MNKIGIASLALVMTLAAVPAMASAEDEQLPHRTPYSVPLGLTMSFVVPGPPVGLEQIVPNAAIVGVTPLVASSIVDVECVSGGPVCSGFILSV